ncbi:Sorbose 5-dehydrogenase (NADP(+)) [Penicillium chermesinum]|uniref:Sorbose 5-dehydrogenase (NADP(+)) n=1 Tax=Penicillium chermesinum TaxID=63820 RepID=A0A9W9P8F0_9EURO|nr:Sorbose 5-dehydrogenase (NADP(+)) [Penicillium chermesinum]KAJ5238362.1 Sorbose 5-dehydrogenase (NADP(+)) [Penicillium chermesinum]KAJ6164029.1 Sorbose 5-dehydrogenase (NADP(+)) [Penicillium chermesinum]
MAQHSIRRVFQIFSIEGKVVIITGGMGAIGIEVARSMADAGADVALWYKSSPKADELAVDVAKEYGVNIRAYKVAGQIFDEVQAAVHAVMRDFGRLDVRIANAGIRAKAGGIDEELDRWHRVVDIDFHGAYYCARAAGAMFPKRARVM